MKQCKKCRRLLPVSEYYSHPKGRDGLRARCKDCLAAQAAAYHAENPRKALTTEEYEERYGEANRRNMRARQRALRLLAQRHPDEYAHLLIIEKALLEEESA